MSEKKFFLKQIVIFVVFTTAIFIAWLLTWGEGLAAGFHSAFGVECTNNIVATLFVILPFVWMLGTIVLIIWACLQGKRRVRNWEKSYCLFILFVSVICSIAVLIIAFGILRLWGNLSVMSYYN